jgi:hypothetical protein
MGIIVPPPDEPYVPSGYACPLLDMDDMGIAIAKVSGVVNSHPTIRWSPNGTWRLFPSAPCSWIGYSSLDELGHAAAFGFTLTVTSAVFGISYLWGPLQVYHCAHPTLRWIGENEWSGWWTGGTHQILFVPRDYPFSVADLADGLRIDTKQKTFIEPISQYPVTQEAVQRFARKHDATCVYIKRALV